MGLFDNLNDNQGGGLLSGLDHLPPWLRDALQGPSQPQQQGTDYSSGFPVPMMPDQSPWQQFDRASAQRQSQPPSWGANAQPFSAAPFSSLPPQQQPAPAEALPPPRNIGYAPGAGQSVGMPLSLAPPEGDGAQLPPNARPAVGQELQQYAAAAQQPGSPLAPPAESPLSAGFHSWAQTPVGSPFAAVSNFVQGASSGRRVDPQGVSQQNLQAQYKGLIDAGVPSGLAMAALSNPEVMKSVIQGASDLATKGPQVQEIVGPDGEKHPAIWDQKSRQYQWITPGSFGGTGQRGGAPAQGGNSMWAGAQGADASASPLSVPQPPPGVNVQEYRKETAKKTADEMQLLREKSLGAIDFLTISPRAKEIYKGAPDVFGPWVGSEAYNNYVRALGATVNADAAKNMERYNQVQGVTKDLSTSGLKARYGARITNVDVAQNNAMFGGLQSASADSALQSLSRMEKDHFDTLQQGVRMGLIDARNIPGDIVQRGINEGALDPKYFPGVQKQATDGGWQTVAPGIRIREKR